MAARKMTFSIPEELAGEFLRNVPARDRSRYVAAALARSLKDRHEELAHACDVANQDRDVLLIEQEFDAIAGDIAEPWNDTSTR
jgi:hypothetical protein